MFTGHKMGPPLCETRNGRDGDKLLCNNGLVKLIVFHELQKVKREWSAFLFSSGIGVEGTGASPQVKETSSSKTTEPAESKSRRFFKLKPRK